MKGMLRLRHKLGLGSENPQRFDLSFLKAALTGSETRLGDRRVDVLMLHSPSHAVLTNPSILDWLLELRQSGRVAAIGFSNLSPSVEDLSASGPFDLVGMRATPEQLARAREKSTGVLAYQVLKTPEFLDCSPAQRLQTCAALDGVHSVVAGMSSLTHLDANISAINATSEQVTSPK